MIKSLQKINRNKHIKIISESSLQFTHIYITKPSVRKGRLQKINHKNLLNHGNKSIYIEHSLGVSSTANSAHYRTN